MWLNRLTRFGSRSHEKFSNTVASARRIHRTVRIYLAEGEEFFKQERDLFYPELLILCAHSDARILEVLLCAQRSGVFFFNILPYKNAAT